MDRIVEFLRLRKTKNLFRILQPANFRKEGKVYFNGKKYIDFSANDYLGLSTHSRLLSATQDALKTFGLGACASRLLSGDSRLHHQLEEKTAIFKGKERGLIFNSGYQANLGIISALCRSGDAIFSDRLNHASIVDGILLSRARLFRFQHNDVTHLELLLKKERNKFKQALIVTETIFSMDGDKCLLKAIVELKERYNCQLLVDEAHATGIFGRSGSGIVEEQGLTERVDLIMGTFSKALGSFGAYVVGEKTIIDYLINSSRSFIYSTALPPAIISANLTSLELVRDEPARRKTLLENAAFFRRELKKRRFSIKGRAQIVPLVLGETKKVISLSRKLRDRGYWVFPIRPPTVPQGQARLRFSLSYDHKREILKKLVSDICSLIHESTLR